MKPLSSFPRLLRLILAGFCFAVPGRLRAEPAPPAAPAASPAALLEKGKVQRCTYFFEEAKREMPYALYVPTGYRPEQPAPLIVLLHGLGSNPFQIIHYAGIIEEAEKRGYIVAAPDGYGLAGWYGSRGPGRDARGGIFQGRDAPENLGALSERDVLNVLDRVRKQLHVDPARIYLMGHSMGGGGTFHIGMKYPETWAALAALSPAIYSDPNGLKVLRNLPVMVVQGDSDRLVSVVNTRVYVAKMEQLGVPHQYLELKGGDHVFSIAFNAPVIAQVFDFLDAHHR